MSISKQLGMEMYQQNQWLPLKLKIAICSSYMFIWHKRKHAKKRKKKKTLAVTAGCVRFFEKRLKAALEEEGGGEEGEGGGGGDGLKSSVGGFAYSAGWSAEFSGNSVLCGTGHGGRDLVDRVRRRCDGAGFGARAAGEGAFVIYSIWTFKIFLICPTHRIARRRGEDLRGKVFKGHDLSVVLHDGLQVERPLLIEALVESQPGLDGSAGIDTGGPH